MKYEDGKAEAEFSSSQSRGISHSSCQSGHDRPSGAWISATRMSVLQLLWLECKITLSQFQDIQ